VRPSKHTSIKIVLSAAILIAFPSVPLLLLNMNIHGSHGIEDLKKSKSLDPPVDNYYGSPVEVYSAESSDLCVTFGFLTLDPAATSAEFAILVGVTNKGLQTLKRLTAYNTLSVDIKSNVGLSSTEINVPISDLTDNSTPSNCSTRRLDPQGALLGAAGFRTIEDIFVLGQPRSFPDDWYELYDSVIVHPSKCNQAPSQTECKRGEALPASLVMMSRDEDMSVMVGTGDGSGTSQLKFTMRRPWLIRAYTYWVAAMPFLLLAALFGIYTYKRKKNGLNRKAPEIYEIAFGVAATLVAILPLRLVLVPSSLPGLTRLDIVFSIEVTFLVASSIVWMLYGGDARKCAPVERDEVGPPDKPAV
jgi:hypothetical protein